MNYLFTEVRISEKMLNFFSHANFENETANIVERFPLFSDALKSFKLIAEVQFSAESPRLMIAPGKIHRVTVKGLATLWKVELAVKGLKANQSPRIWFAVQGNTLVFLCAKTHIDNYDNNEVDREAEEYISDFF